MSQDGHGNRRCWARCHDACAGKMSNEHYVSEALFDVPSIWVRGFPWCKHEPVEIGIRSAVAKTLCERHNSRLSPVDEGGARAFHALREMHRLERARSKLEPRQWRVKRTEIDGVALERWFTKTAMNLVCLQPRGLRWKVNGRPADDPPEEFVAVAYGGEMPPNAGLYFAAQVGDQVGYDDTVVFGPLLRGDEIYGALFRFQGSRFVLWFLDEALPANPPSFGTLSDEWRGQTLRRHMLEFRSLNRGHLSQSVQFNW